MFRNREEAGRQLAEMLNSESFDHPLVLAVPRGGVVTGATLAAALNAELDVVLSRKLREPDQPELAMGAISESGEVYLIGDGDELPGVTDEYFHRERQHQLELITNQRERIRAAVPKAPIAGRSVIVTDDGIATGSTMIAALQTVRAEQPSELVVAVPVAPADRVSSLEPYCDRVVCLQPADHFWSVGQFYADFPPVEDDQVIDIILKYRSAHMR